MRNSLTRFVIVGGLMLVAIGYLLFSSMNSSMVYYYTVDEVLAGKEDLSGKGTRISGWVKPGSVSLSDSGKGVVFAVYSRESGASLQVEYSGIVPDTFKEDSEVVVEGLWNSSARLFEASVLLAKCPSKYEGRGDSHPENLQIEKDKPGE